MQMQETKAPADMNTHELRKAAAEIAKAAGKPTTEIRTRWSKEKLTAYILTGGATEPEPMRVIVHDGIVKVDYLTGNTASVAEWLSIMPDLLTAVGMEPVINATATQQRNSHHANKTATATQLSKRNATEKVTSRQGATYERVITLAKLGRSQTEIVTELGVNKSNVCRHIRRAREQGQLA